MLPGCGNVAPLNFPFYKFFNKPSPDFFGFHAEKLTSGWIGLYVAAIIVCDEHGILCRFKQSAKEALLFLYSLALGDVLNDAKHTYGLSLVIALDASATFDPVHSPVRPANAIFLPVVSARLQTSGYFPLDRFPILWMNAGEKIVICPGETAGSETKQFFVVTLASDLVIRDTPVPCAQTTYIHSEPESLVGFVCDVAAMSDLLPKVCELTA